tara:strand:+ start:111 stop:260 length:150 start_codon:yes stop_codon:yes gene_type:complete
MGEVDCGGESQVVVGLVGVGVGVLDEARASIFMFVFEGDDSAIAGLLVW